MTKPMNTSAIEKATNKQWSQWVAELDESGARGLTHTELAATLNTMLKDTLENHGWWAQGITVAYEQHIGKRIPGQLANGMFELAVSKTITKPRDDLFAQTVTWFETQKNLNGKAITKPRTSRTPKRSNWRCDFADGSRFAATVEGDDKKSKLVLSHTSVPSKSEADDWKSFWTTVAGALASM